MGLTVNIVGSVILLLLRYKLGETVEVSKACYGTRGQPCTTHMLSCSSGRVAIQEAFYMDSTACGTIGVSNCAGINHTAIQLTGTRYNFNDTEMNSLNRDCSTQSTCIRPADRRKTLTFSAIIYECIDATSLKTTTEQTTLTTGRQATIPTLASLTASTESTASVVSPDQTIVTEIGTVASESTTAGTKLTTRTCSTEASNGLGWMFAAGLFSGLAIAAVVAGIVYFLYIRRRCVLKKQDPSPASTNHLTYTGLTDLGLGTLYNSIQTLMTSSTDRK